VVQESKIEEESDGWDNMNTNSKGAQMVDPNPAQSVDNRGPIVVPFFPTHWQETSNLIFNNDFVLIHNDSPNTKAHQ